MLSAGDPAPDFDLHGVAGEETGTFRLSAAARDGPVILAFCGNDLRGTDGEFVDALAGADWASVADRLALLVVVPNSRTQDRLVGGDGVPVPVLADQDGFVAGLYGLVSGSRAAFLVDERCTVRSAHAVAADPAATAAALRDALSAR